MIALAGVRFAWRETRALLGLAERPALPSGESDPEAAKHDVAALMERLEREEPAA